MPDTTTITIRVPNDLIRLIRELAKDQVRSLNAEIVYLLMQSTKEKGE